MNSEEITQEYLKQLFDCDPITGHLTWSKNHVKQNYIGKRAGFVDNYNGYRHIVINGRKYREHRIIWMWYTGEFPKEQLDHINGIRDDNSIDNLRECTNKQNSENRTKFNNKKKTSKYIGVQHRGAHIKSNKQWRARIMHNMKNIGLGYFETEEEAYNAYVEAKAKYHSFAPIVHKNISNQS